MHPMRLVFVEDHRKEIPLRSPLTFCFFSHFNFFLFTFDPSLSVPHTTPKPKHTPQGAPYKFDNSPILLISTSQPIAKKVE